MQQAGSRLPTPPFPSLLKDEIDSARERPADDHADEPEDCVAGHPVEYSVPRRRNRLSASHPCQKELRKAHIVDFAAPFAFGFFFVFFRDFVRFFCFAFGFFRFDFAVEFFFFSFPFEFAP